jgi:hypothetical protein
MTSEFIVYACPIGELAHQLDAYFAKSLAMCGENAAHQYMPHCTLTGFFRDDDSAIPLYVEAIAQSLSQSQSQPCPSPVITIQQLTFRSDWHGLELQSDWLKQLIVNFAAIAHSPTRSDALRLKDWLHLSLAYDFRSEHAEMLTQLAQQLIHTDASVEWELRFYQRQSDRTWICHQFWRLEGERGETAGSVL